MKALKPHTLQALFKVMHWVTQEAQSTQPEGGCSPTAMAALRATLGQAQKAPNEEQEHKERARTQSNAHSAQVSTAGRPYCTFGVTRESCSLV